MENREIVGVEITSFTGKDGTPVNGKTIHTLELIDPKRGQGKRADHFFLSTAKLAALNFTPEPNQSVAVFYNRYGQIATLTLLSDVAEEIVID